MTPESNFSLVPPGVGEEALHASYRRGRLLVLVLAITTGAIYVVSTLPDYLAGKDHAKLSDLLGNYAFVGFMCGCLYRGGPLTKGCLVIICAPLAVGLLMIGPATVFNILVPFGHASFGIDGFYYPGADWQATLKFIPVGAWAVYGCWALLISRDARLYRRLRHREVTTAEALAFEWKCEQRRQERSSHAS